MPIQYIVVLKYKYPTYRDYKCVTFGQAVKILQMLKFRLFF